MLQSIHIENYALIRETTVCFHGGYVAITGETGAGKSILLGALGLLLGTRADASVLADHGRKCVVEAQFDITSLGLEPLFQEADIDYDDTLILHREILPSAKSRAFVNDTPVQLPFLRTLGARIIDIHSQHQTLTLADSSFRLSLLDTLAASPTPVQSFRTAYHRYAQLKHELESLTVTEAQNRKEADYLQFQFNELNEARLQDNEQEVLEQESRLLSHTEAVREALSTATAAIDNDTEAAPLSRLRMAKSALSRVVSYHPDVENIVTRIESTLIELDDINSTLSSLADTVTFSPERQQEVDNRLALIYRLQKKHGVDNVHQLIELRNDLDTRLQDISTLDGRIQALMEQVDQAFSEVQRNADTLTAIRIQAGKDLEKNILPILHELGMPEARFSVEIVPTPTYSPTGHDTVQFLFNANRGGELRDLAKVASGGELSRLMLAIKSMLTSRLLLPTIIFDEIDTGVSGDISVAVGCIMRRMADRMQVISITHLPQIAAKAEQHLKVYKETDEDATVSRIRELSPKERINEIAIMLSSDPPTPAALQTAQELMS